MIWFILFVQCSELSSCQWKVKNSYKNYKVQDRSSKWKQRSMIEFEKAESPSFRHRARSSTKPAKKSRQFVRMFNIIP